MKCNTITHMKCNTISIVLHIYSVCVCYFDCIVLLFNVMEEKPTFTRTIPSWVTWCALISSVKPCCIAVGSRGTEVFSFIFGTKRTIRTSRTSYWYIYTSVTSPVYAKVCTRCGLISNIKFEIIT